MKHGPCWEATCSACTAEGISGTAWQRERPPGTPPACGWCGSPTTWKYTLVRKLDLRGRRSGFSHSESDFVPHYSTAFGRPVKSLAQMKALQKKHGTQDTVVKGDGADRHAPRDIGRRLKRHRDLAAAANEGRTFDAGHGVKVEFGEIET